MKLGKILVVMASAAFVVCAMPVFGGEKDEVTEVPFVEGKAPPVAEPGQVWCLVTKPATFKTETEKVLVSPETFYYEKVPATYEEVEEKIMVEPEKKNYRFVPAKWKTTTVKKLVQEASTRLEVTPAKMECVQEELQTAPMCESETMVPATYKRVPQKILVAPERMVIKRVDCDTKGAKYDADTGFCYMMCKKPAAYRQVCTTELVEEAKFTKSSAPEQKMTYNVMKVVEPPKVKEIKIDAVYKDFCVKEIVEPGKWECDVTPAKYETIKKLVKKDDESQKKVNVPAVYKTATHRVLDKPATMVWRKCAVGCGEVSRLMKEYGCVPGLSSVTE